MARPTKLTPAVQAVIVQALTVGCTKRLACQYAGITEKTFYEWLKRGEDDEAVYGEFFQSIRKAEGASLLRALMQIDKAAQEGTWQAAAWMLERRYPHEYGRRVVEEHHTGHVVHSHAWIERLQQGLDEKRTGQRALPEAQRNGHVAAQPEGQGRGPVDAATG